MGFLSDRRAKKALEKRYAKAERILKSKKIDDFLEKLERKVKRIPRVGKRLSGVVVLISALKSYILKEYTAFPKGTLIAVVAALAYFLSPVDILPDIVPFAGYIDDAAVVAFCWKMIDSDISDYMKWRRENKRDELV